MVRYACQKQEFTYVCFCQFGDSVKTPQVTYYSISAIFVWNTAVIIVYKNMAQRTSC